MRLARIFQVVPFLLLMLLLTPAAAACSCSLPLDKNGNLLTPEQLARYYWRPATAVFTGKVTEVTAIYRDPNDEPVDHVVKVRVNEQFKGKRLMEVSFNTGTGRGDCSLGPLRDAEQYLFYAWPSADGNHLDIAMCSGTRRFPEEDDREWVARHNAELAILRKLARKDKT
jgi:hypothetical protein